MNKCHREWVKNVLSHYGQEFEPNLVHEDDKFFIMDWKDKNGSGNLAIRYIVDKEKGDLIIKGDAGDCIASWFNPVSVEDMARYINSTFYFIEKIQCTTNKYTYKREDIKGDLEEKKQEYLQMFRDEDLNLEIVDESEIEEDFEMMEDILAEYGMREDAPYPCELTELLEKYDSDWWESFNYLGRRIDKRIYLWIYGYQDGVERLRGRELVRKDK